jgi:hypothetical protein
MRLIFWLFVVTNLLLNIAKAQNFNEFKIARAQYRGGGDWYNDPSALTNLLSFVRQQTGAAIATQYDDVPIGSRDIFKYPFVFLTGHGNIAVNGAEAANLRSYMDKGGFLYIDDDYGLDPHARALIRAVFPDAQLVEVPFEHPIYNMLYPYKNGLPKIHEHDGKPPKGYGIFREGRLVLFYTYECNLGDGWADPDIHNTPPSLRAKSFEMGANVLLYALLGS